jgi:hypothetical protein
MGSVVLNLDFVVMVKAIVNLPIAKSNMANVGKHVLLCLDIDTENERLVVFHDCIINLKILFMSNM